MDETFIADVPTYATIETGPDALARMTSSNAQSNFDATSETWTTTNLPTYATIETGPDGLARMTNANAGKNIHSLFKYWFSGKRLRYL